MPSKSPKTAPVIAAKSDITRALRMEAARSPGIAIPTNSLPLGILQQWATRWDFYLGGTSLCQTSRGLSSSHSFYAPFVERMIGTLNYGLKVTVNGTERLETPIVRLARDIWREHLVSANAVAFWLDDSAPTVFYTENVTYTDVLGKESIKITLPKSTLPTEQLAELPARIRKAVTAGGQIEVINGRNGENFRVWSTGKAGAGFGEPRIKSAILDLAIFELLQMAELHGAKARGTLIRHTKKGHEIGQGPLSGQPLYFFKADWGKKFSKLLAGSEGYKDIATNFDVGLGYVYLPAEFFDRKVYDSVYERLCSWAGPLAFLLRESSDGRSVNNMLMDLLRADVLQTRRDLLPFFRDVMAAQCRVPAKDVEVKWSSQALYTAEMMLKLVTGATSGGLMSPQTGREWLGLDDERESERLKDAHTRPDDYTPAFEQKQGMAGDPNADPGGRPTGANDTGSRSRSKPKK